MMPSGTSRPKNSKIRTQTAWICRRAPKTECSARFSVITMPMPKSAAKTSTRMLSLPASEAKMLVGTTAIRPRSAARVPVPARTGSRAKVTSIRSAELPTKLPIRANIASSTTSKLKIACGTIAAAAVTRMSAINEPSASRPTTRPPVPLVIAERTASGIVVNRNGSTQICSNAM